MAKKRKGKRGHSVLWYMGIILLFIAKTPYYIVKGVYSLIKWLIGTFRKEEIQNKREKIPSKYEEFKVIKTLSGDYKKWISKVFRSDSQIGIIIGSRGSGKTAFGIKLLEDVHVKTDKKCYAMGFKEEGMPSWINVISDISQIENNSFILVDEGGILFNARKAMSKANEVLSDLILISRHKNLSILFISQNSSNLEVNILRQADFLVLKHSSLLQKEFERKIIQKFYEESEENFEKFKDVEGLTYIYADIFKGFISNSLPSFWKESISKAFK
ncbi:MAG: zonular occludens toxin domain-containing protein [archaeon]